MSQAQANRVASSSLDAPLLLTDPDALSEVAADEIRLGIETVVLIGGEDALSAEVAEDLQDAGVDTRRIAGPDRFATAAAIAAELMEEAGSATVLPYIVEGEHADPSRGWPDAVATAPVAAFEAQPILLVNAERLPDATVEALGAIDAAAVTIVGGPVAVSDAVQDELADEGYDGERVAGATRYATSALLHDRMVAAGMDGTEIWLATGTNWPDALAAGPTVAGLGHSFALVDGDDLDGSPETRDVLTDAVRAVHLLGGTDAISDRVRDQVEGRLAG